MGTSVVTRTALSVVPTISASDRGPLMIPRSGNLTNSLADLSQLACLLVNTFSQEGPKEIVRMAFVHLAAIQPATTLGQSAMLTSGGPLTPSGDAETENDSTVIPKYLPNRQTRCLIELS